MKWKKWFNTHTAYTLVPLGILLVCLVAGPAGLWKVWVAFACVSLLSMVWLYSHIRKMSTQISSTEPKVAYICGALTELPPEMQASVKRFYSRLSDVYKWVSGCHAFVPHEHYDPIAHANFTPTQVYRAEREQVCEHTSVLIVVAIHPSWGGGIEIAWTGECNIPIILLVPAGKSVSRLLRGVPNLAATITYIDDDDAFGQLEYVLRDLRPSAGYRGLVF